MTKAMATNLNLQPMMASSYFYYTMARFFAGLFGVPKMQYCRVHS